MNFSLSLAEVVKKNKMDLFEQMIQDDNQDLNEQDREGFTALMYAALKGNEKVVRKLIEKKAEINQINANGDNALMFSILYNYPAISKLLILSGIHLNKQNNQGKTPLMAASFKGDGELVLLMIERGADPFLRDENYETAIDKARIRGYTLLANRMIKEGNSRSKCVLSKAVGLKTFFKLNGRENDRTN